MAQIPIFRDVPCLQGINHARWLISLAELLRVTRFILVVFPLSDISYQYRLRLLKVGGQEATRLLTWGQGVASAGGRKEIGGSSNARTKSAFNLCRLRGLDLVGRVEDLEEVIPTTSNLRF